SAMMHSTSTLAPFMPNNTSRSSSSGRTTGQRPRDPFASYRDSVANMLHHDAVTGTEKNFVALDYTVQLAHGKSNAVPAAAVAAGVLTKTSSTDDPWRATAQVIVDMCSGDGSGARVN